MCIFNELDRKMLLQFRQKRSLYQEMRFCLAKHCTSFPAPFQDGHRCRILCLGRKFDLYFQIQGKTNKLGLFRTASAAFFKDGLLPSSGGVFRAQTTETVWESMLKSPEQFRNYFSCSHFRSKTKTPSRNKHILLCIYF